MAERTFNTPAGETPAALKFIPEVIAAGIEKQLPTKWVFVDGCNRNYEGIIKKKGDTVQIRTVGKITAHRITRSADRSHIAPAEELEGDMLTLPIDQITYTNSKVDSIDELATDVSLMDATTSEMADALAGDHDSYVAELVDTAKNAVTDGGNNWFINPKNVVDMLLEAKNALKRKNVPDSAVLEFIGPTEIETVLTKAGILIKTANDELYKNGNIGKVLGVNIKVSNNVYQNLNGTSYYACCLRVRDKAMAFAEQISKVKTYRIDDEELDADFIKSYSLFGSKVLFNDYMVKIPVAGVSLSADDTSIGISVDVAPSYADLLGKKASQLQKDIAFGSGAITGTLKYVAEYNGFSAGAKGNFIALHITPKQANTTITVEIVGGTSGEVTLDADGLFIGQIEAGESIRIKATKGDTTKTYNYALTDLVLKGEDD